MTKLDDVQANWEKYGEQDPLWGILAWPGKEGNRWDAESFFQTGVDEISAVLDYVEGLDFTLIPGVALDFGCGVGRLSQALAAHFERVEGVDISPSMLDMARAYNRFGERCRYHLNERDDLRLFADASFDFIYSNITLQHMPPRFSRAYIVEFLRVLKPTGVLLFQIPSRPRRRTRRLTQWLRPTRGWKLYQRLRYGDEPVMDMYGIPRRQVLALLAEHGARVLDVQPDDQADTHWTSFRYCATLASS